MSNLSFFLTGEEDRRTELEIALMTNNTKFLDEYYKKEDEKYAEVKKDGLSQYLAYITSNGENDIMPNLERYDNFVVTMFLARNPANIHLTKYLAINGEYMSKESHIKFCRSLASKKFYKYFSDVVAEKFKTDIVENSYVTLLQIEYRLNIATARKNYIELKAGKLLDAFATRLKKKYPMEVIKKLIMDMDYTTVQKDLLIKKIEEIFGKNND